MRKELKQHHALIRNTTTQQLQHASRVTLSSLTARHAAAQLASFASNIFTGTQMPRILALETLRECASSMLVQAATVE